MSLGSQIALPIGEFVLARPVDQQPLAEFFAPLGMIVLPDALREAS
jgi:hypothetical protein